MTPQKTCLRNIGLPSFLEYPLERLASAFFYILRHRNLSDGFQEILPVWRVPCPDVRHFFAQAGRIGLTSQELIQQMKYGRCDAAWSRYTLFYRNCQGTD